MPSKLIDHTARLGIHIATHQHYETIYETIYDALTLVLLCSHSTGDHP